MMKKELTSLFARAVDMIVSGETKCGNPWITASKNSTPEKASHALEKAAEGVRAFYSGCMEMSQAEAEAIMAYEVLTAEAAETIFDGQGNFIGVSKGPLYR